jgi:hypothetical protein
MKLFFTSIISIVSIIALAQAPQKISYQAVARQANGAVISNAPIGVKFIIYQGSVGGTISYEETHNANTNQLGLFTLFIGGGFPSIGVFNTINWAIGPYFIETQIDPAGGTSYASIGTQQLMSVPYALFAERAGNSSPTPTININSPNTIANPTTGIYNISVPSYSAGTGISISSGIITNTATSTTPTININTPNTISNPATGVYNISVPSYSAGTGISISSGVITNTASSITPTLVAGANMIVNPMIASNSYTVSAPNYSLSTPSNTLLLLSNGNNNSTAIIPTQLLSLSGSTLTAGPPTNSVNISSISPWTQSVGSVTLSNAGDKVGIGTNIPNAALDVVTNSNSISAGILSNTNTSNITNVLEVANTSTVGGKGIYTHTSGGNALYGTTTSGFPAIEALGGSSNAIYGTANSSSASFAGTNNGIGEVYYASKTSTQSGGVARFENLSSTNTVSALYVSSNSSGEAIHAVSSNTVTGTSGIFDGNVIVNGNITIPGANDYKYAFAKTKYLNIPSNALHSMSGAYDVTLGTYVSGYDGESGYAYIANGGTTGATAVATAPVYLPDGAIVTELYVRYYDQDATYNGTFSLERKNISSINNQTMVSYTSIGSASSPAGPGIQSLTTILNPIIDNANYEYYFKFKTTQLNTNIAVLDIRITYNVLKAD